jgi:hypothetical protein
MKITGKLICASLLLVAVVAGARPLSPRIVNPNNGHSYLLLGAATWKDSEAQALALGGHLATIRNRAEEDWIVRTFGSYGNQQRLLWIGLSDVTRKFHFSWSSGESLSYTYWAEGEPNNALSGEDFVAIYYPGHSQGGKWNDWNDRTEDPIGLPMNGVVEIIPVAAHEPTVEATQLPLITIHPALVISNDSGSIRLQWPAAVSGYLLEATTNLTQPFTMFGYSEITNVESGMISVFITNPSPQMFFRLRKP